MGTMKVLLLAGAASLGAASLGGARAADLPPPPPIMEPMPVEPVDFGGWYLRGDVGVGVASRPDIKSTFSTNVPELRHEQENLGDASFVGLGLGYQFNAWLRADITGEYRTSQSLTGTESFNLGAFSGFQRLNNRPYDQYFGNVQSSVVLANGYIDLGTWLGFTPFIGAGIGGSYNRVYGLTDMGFPSLVGAGGGGFGYAKDSGKFDLAYAAHAGLAYAVSPNLKLELAYRYLNMGDARSAPIVCQNSSQCTNEVQKVGLESQDIKLGMRWMFSDIAPVAPAYYPPPPPPPAPLVRKY